MALSDLVCHHTTNHHTCEPPGVSKRVQLLLEVAQVFSRSAEQVPQGRPSPASLLLLEEVRLPHPRPGAELSMSESEGEASSSEDGSQGPLHGCGVLLAGEPGRP